MQVMATSPAGGVLATWRMILRAGEESYPRARATLEVINYQLVIRLPWAVPFDIEGRNLRPFIGAVEAAQLVGQVADPDLVAAGSPPMASYQDGGVFEGSYPIRVHGLLRRLVEELRDDPDSRRAVLSVHAADRDLGARTSDVPCTLSLQYLLRDGELHARTSMRSNDAWLGLPYDLIQFIALQGAVAAALGVRMGTYCHTVGSMHAYETDVEQMRRAVGEAGTPPLPGSYDALWGGFGIEEVSRRARTCLRGRAPADATPFEAWVADAIRPATDRLTEKETTA